MLYEKLNSKDIDTFCSYIMHFGPSSGSTVIGGMSDPSHILRIWDQAKSEYLYRAFGNQFILERPIEFTQPRKDLCRVVRSKLEFGGELHPFKATYKHAVQEQFDVFSAEYCDLLNLLNSEALADNIIMHTCSSKPIRFNNGQSIKLVRGAKTIKMLGRVCKALGLEREFEQFRIAHSMILNKKSLKGTLCLSIHPMDYITMSDNDNGWSSCMSWHKDGDYRMGTVEMMNSPNVVVAYLKSEDHLLTWDRYSWNSKIWRTLVVVDPTTIITVKGYPYQHQDIAETCVEWLQALVTQNLQWEFPDGCAELGENSSFTYAGEKKYLCCETNKMYNDFGACIHFGALSRKAFGDRQTIIYSGPAECMWCGSTNESAFYLDTNFVFCAECADGGDGDAVCCDNCGERCYYDDIYWIHDEIPLCPYCVEQLAATCALTEEYFYNSEVENVYLIDTDSKNPPSIVVSTEFVMDESNYSPFGWLSRYIKRPPKRSDEGYLYWTMEDVTSHGLRRYF